MNSTHFAVERSTDGHVVADFTPKQWELVNTSEGGDYPVHSKEFGSAC